jgi:hypothetical protein
MAEGKYNAYYRLFDDATERGKVLDDDWSGDWETKIPPIKTNNGRNGKVDFKVKDGEGQVTVICE